MKYIRLNEDDTIGFLDDEIHEITDSDVSISEEEYSNLITLQESGESLTFRLFMTSKD